MIHLVEFTDPRADDPALVGGKGANLGRLARAGFLVPSGFTVVTSAYASFLATGLADRIGATLAGADLADADDVEKCSARIRELIETTPLPTDLISAIDRAHTDLGAECVAVRSSGTAEDLAGASFAGLHDTFLDVRGPGLADAVRRCWSSMWTARAITYRASGGFDHLEARMAVIVQTMVAAEVAGVLFTGNPVNAATDEMVIDANWGLGESVVSGLVTPDQYVVRAGGVHGRTLGSKAHRVVRAPGGGTVTEDVPDAERTAWTLTDEQALHLAALGARVQEHYDGLPQDLEWALLKGQVHLLQSRPITGVDFSWDEDCDFWQSEEDDPDAVWTRSIADEAWSGAITPLMYSWRGPTWPMVYHYGLPFMGRDDLRGVRGLKYHRAEAYLNCALERGYIEAAPPLARPGLLGRLPESWRAETAAVRWDGLGYVKTLVKIKMLLPEQGVWSWLKIMHDYIDNRNDEAAGLSNEQMRALGDRELEAYIQAQIDWETRYIKDVAWPGLFMYCRDVMSFLFWAVANWYDGDNPNAIGELITGTPNPTITVVESVELGELAAALRSDEALLAAFRAHPGAEFFERLTDTEAGRGYQARCAGFLAKRGHRGHADRDIYYPRYADDPGLLYRSIEAHLKTDEDPLANLAANNARREEVVDDVVANMSRKPFGFLRVEAFKLALQYALVFLEIRDNERSLVDHSTYSIRRGFVEVNRRIRERGRLESDRDFWFLTQPELFEVLDGTANLVLAQAKIAGRMRNFDAFDRREVTLPKWLHRGRELEAEAAATALPDGARGYQGLPTSRGVASGTARVVKHLDQIGKVDRGDILVVNSTDPGWTPVFALVKGIVAETGGLLSHCSSLAREHGIPAAQLEGALALIPDGAQVEVNGDTGRVMILAD